MTDTQESPPSIAPVPQTRRRKLAFWLGLPFAFLAACGIAFLTFCTTIYFEAEYSFVTFRGSGNSYTEFEADEESKLFVKFRNGPPIALHALKESDLQQSGSVEKIPPEDWLDATYTCEGGVFHFHKGRFNRMHTFNGSGIAISNRENGEFITLPASCVRVHEIFGRPTAIRRELYGHGISPR